MYWVRIFKGLKLTKKNCWRGNFLYKLYDKPFFLTFQERLTEALWVTPSLSLGQESHSTSTQSSSCRSHTNLMPTDFPSSQTVPAAPSHLHTGPSTAQASRTSSSSSPSQECVTIFLASNLLMCWGWTVSLPKYLFIYIYCVAPMNYCVEHVKIFNNLETYYV